MGIDVILLDVSLPDSQEWSIFEPVRSRAKGLPIILLTGGTDEEPGLRALKEGAQDYICKGRVDSAEPARAIRYAIERQQADMALTQYQEHLEELVSERTVAFTLANDQLQHGSVFTARRKSCWSRRRSASGSTLARRLTPFRMSPASSRRRSRP